MTETQMETIVCKKCSRIIRDDFSYCSWCGISLTKKAEKPSEFGVQKLNDIETRIGRLEKELDVLVVCAEIRK